MYIFFPLLVVFCFVRGRTKTSLSTYFVIKRNICWISFSSFTKRKKQIKPQLLDENLDIHKNFPNNFDIFLILMIIRNENL